MSNHLRELAEKWKAGGSTSPIGPLHAAGINDGFKFAADELLAILDAEGDGGAEVDGDAPELFAGTHAGLAELSIRNKSPEDKTS